MPSDIQLKLTVDHFRGEISEIQTIPLLVYALDTDLAALGHLEFTLGSEQQLLTSVPPLVFTPTFEGLEVDTQVQRLRIDGQYELLPAAIGSFNPSSMTLLIDCSDKTWVGEHQMRVQYTVKSFLDQISDRNVYSADFMLHIEQPADNSTNLSTLALNSSSLLGLSPVYEVKVGQSWLLKLPD